MQSKDTKELRKFISDYCEENEVGVDVALDKVIGFRDIENKKNARLYEIFIKMKDKTFEEFRKDLNNRYGKLEYNYKGE